MGDPFEIEAVLQKPRLSPYPCRSLTLLCDIFVINFKQLGKSAQTQFTSFLAEDQLRSRWIRIGRHQHDLQAGDDESDYATTVTRRYGRERQIAHG